MKGVIVSIQSADGTWHPAEVSAVRAPEFIIGKIETEVVVDVGRLDWVALWKLKAKAFDR